MQPRNFLMIALFIGGLALVEPRQQLKEHVKNQDLMRTKRFLYQDDNNTIPDEHIKPNEHQSEARIVLHEPFKSALQGTARFALAQTKIMRHINIDTAMNFLNDGAYFLSKPKVLLKVLKTLAVSLATFAATLMFFPGAHQFVESAWNDPFNTLNLDRYLTNGMHERSVIALLGSKTDETLARVGLQDDSCRERSICYLGEILKCSFPDTSEAITKFASENFSNTGMREGVYARAFVSGFVDRNCTKVGSHSGSENQQNCLSVFVNSLLTGVDQQRSSNNNNKVKK